MKHAQIPRDEVLGSAHKILIDDIFTNVLCATPRKLGYLSLFALPAVFGSQLQEAHATEAATAVTVPIDAETKRATLRSRSSCPDRPAFLKRQTEYRLPHQRGTFNAVQALAGNDDCPGRAIPSGTYTAAAPYLDTGNTTGANDTVSLVTWFYYCYTGSIYTAGAAGPDHVYSFTLTGRGPNPRIEVTTTSGTYRPMVYVLEGTGSCPVGCARSWRTAAAPGGSVVLDREVLRRLPLNTPLYLFIDSGNPAGPDGSGPYTVRIQDVGVAPSPPPGVQRRIDFDGDARADLAVFRPSNGTWYASLSTGGFRQKQFGLSTDKITPGSLYYFTGGATHMAVYRNGVWWVSYNFSFTDHFTRQFGSPNDTPVPADYSGDGIDDLAVYRNGTWEISDSVTGQITIVQFGQAGDRPVPADYDGDGRVDQAVYRNGEWHLNRSTLGYTVMPFGIATDLPVVGDYDGDGRADLAVYRDGVWWLLQSTDGIMVFQFGTPSDTPVPDDYDGDGKTDAGIFRNGQWWLKQSNAGITVLNFGQAGDKPLQAAYLP